MRSNKALGFTEIAAVGNYTIGRKGNTFRVWGEEWKSDDSAENEGPHHASCGRGSTIEEAIDKWVAMATQIGRVTEEASGARDWWDKCDGLTADECAKIASQLLAECEDAVDV